MGMTIVRLLGRVWIPLVILLVAAVGGFVVSRIHGIFGSENLPRYVDSHVSDTNTYDAKKVRYEVFGPEGTVANISYFDVNTQPQRVDQATLPWSMTMTINSVAVVADIVAQGDGNSIACRILVDGQIKAERVSNEMNAYTHCLLSGA